MTDGAPIGIELIDLLPPALRRDVAARLRWSRAARGRMMVSAGETARDVFFLVAGEAQVLLFSPDGREVTVQAIAAPDMFGELAALDGRPRSASVVASADVCLARLDHAEFLRCLRESPDAAEWLIRRLADGMRRLTERVFELSALSVSGRIRCELVRLAGRAPADGDAIRISPAPTHAAIASLVGTQREAVTREFALLAEAGMLRTGRRMIEIIDLPRLAAATISADH